MFAVVQTVRQNSANWKYTLKGDNVVINMNFVVKITSFTEEENKFYKIYLLKEDERFPIVITEKEFSTLPLNL